MPAKNLTSVTSRGARVAALLISCATIAHADDIAPWLEIIDESNPGILAARQAWKAAEAMTPQASGWADPMIGANVGRTSTQFDDYDMLEYMVEQELPWPGRNAVHAEVARLNAEAVGFEMLEVRRQARADLVAAAWTLWANRQTIRIMREQSALTTALMDTEAARLQAGQAAQHDWLRIAIQRDQLAVDITAMEREIAVTLARLNGLLNADPATPRTTDTMPPRPELTASVEQLQRDARQYCCILMATLWRELAKDKARVAARLEQRPKVSLRVEVRQFQDSGSIDEYDTGIAMNLPWIWRSKYNGMRAEAEADYQEAAAELQNEIAMTLTDIQEMHAMAESSLNTIQLYEEKILPQMRTLADSARDGYPAGMMSAMEMIDAQNMLLESEMTYYKEQAAYAAAYAKLMATAQPWTPDEFATGLPLHGANDDE